MMSWTTIAAGVAIALTGLSAQAYEPSPPFFTSKPSGEQINAWIDRYVDENGWVFIDASDDAAAFLATGGKDRSAYPVLDGWIKWEQFLQNPEHSRSELWHVEVNCAHRTHKILETIYYAGNNGMGAVVRSWKAPPYTPHKAVTPNSMADGYLAAICGIPNEGAT